MNGLSMIVLGIETSCDETAVSLIQDDEDGVPETDDLTSKGPAEGEIKVEVSLLIKIKVNLTIHLVVPDWM